MFQVLFQSFANLGFLYKVKFTGTSSADTTVRKIIKILRSFGFYLGAELFSYMEYSWSYEFSKVGTFSSSAGRSMVVLLFERSPKFDYKVDNRIQFLEVD